MKKHIFTGCATALITPFTDDGNNVDFNAYKKLIDFQLSNKIDALVIAGTTGEAPVLTKSEKREMIDLACKECKNIVPVIAGTGSNNTIEAVKKSNDAEKQGVNGLLIVTPYYNKCTQEGIIKHYEYISSRVSTPIIVYNVPSRTGVNILPETYLELSKIKNISAIKEANADISAFAKTSSLCSSTIDLYSGNDDQLLPMISLGAKGVISVASNIIPNIMKKIIEYAFNNNFNDALELNKKFDELFKMLFCEVNPIPIKCACNLLFGTNDFVRLPLTKIKNEHKYKLSKILYKLSLI